MKEFAPQRKYAVESLDQLRLMADRFTAIDIAISFEPIEAAGQPIKLTSSKTIQYRRSRNGRHWFVHDAATGSEHYHTEPQLKRQTRIVEAIEKGALVVELGSLEPEAE